VIFHLQDQGNHMPLREEGQSLWYVIAVNPFMTELLNLGQMKLMSLAVKIVIPTNTQNEIIKRKVVLNVLMGL